MNEVTGTKERKSQAKLLAVKLTCPNGHLIYESQPAFYVFENYVDNYSIRIQASCDACDINERYFTITVDG